MSLRRAALQAIADTLHPMVKTVKPATIVAAPPSTPAEYPAMALLMDRFVTNWTQLQEIAVDSGGQPLLGTNAILDNSTAVAPALVDGGRILARVGSLRGEGRIWVAARHAAKREEMEEVVLEAFAQDGSAPGRLLATMKPVQMRGWTMPWPWTVAAVIEDGSEWRDEMAFAERLWSYIRFKLDVDMLVPRNDAPLIKKFVLEYDVSVHADPDDDLDADARSVQLATTGDLVPYP